MYANIRTVTLKIFLNITRYISFFLCYVCKYTYSYTQDFSKRFRSKLMNSDERPKRIITFVVMEIWLNIPTPIL